MQKVRARRIALVLVKLMVTLLSSTTLFLLLFGVLPWVLIGIRNGATFPAWYVYSLTFLPVYLSYCIISCTKFLGGRVLVVSGILMHLAFVIWIVVTIMHTNYTHIQAIFITIAGLWIVLATLRLTSEDA